MPLPAARTIDLTHVDVVAFARDVDALHAELVADLGPEDLAHLRKMNRWSAACTTLGYATAWIAPNPLSALLLSLGTFSRWITMHHVGHRGYDRVPGVPERLTSRRFAHGRRRYLDWFDWMLPEAWNHEHNTLHHTRTGEEADPDLVERNAVWLRSVRWPAVAKAVFVAGFAATWRFTYYVPSTIRALHRARRRRAGTPDPTSDEASMQALFDLSDDTGSIARRALVDPRTSEGRDVWLRCLLPYATLRFGLFPAIFGLFGAWAWFSVLVNSLLAEVLTNLHAFAVIVPNHAGDDIPRFEGATHDRGEFYLRQVAGSVNFTGGSDVADFLQGYLNYQVEHHVWPDLPMRQYQRAQPRLQAICARHGVPYVREPVTRRVRKLLAIMLGRATTPVGVTQGVGAVVPRTA